jgi:hypothetical protein
MSTTVIGTSLAKGTPNLEAAGYYVQTWTPGGADIDQEDFDNGTTGARLTRLVYKVDDKISAELLAAGTHTQSTIETHWPEGNKATLAPYGSFFVDSCTIAQSRGAWRVNLSLTNIGI